MIDIDEEQKRHKTWPAIEKRIDKYIGLSDDELKQIKDAFTYGGDYVRALVKSFPPGTDAPMNLEYLFHPEKGVIEPPIERVVSPAGTERNDLRLLDEFNRGTHRGVSVESDDREEADLRMLDQFNSRIGRPY